jgi:hypothetical protein
MLTIIIGLPSWQNIVIGVVLFVITFAVSLAIVSFILVRIPPDYFHKDHPRDLWSDKSQAVRAFGYIGKNLLGVLLVVIGIVLSIPGVPGQGFLTILLGIMLLDFPGKRNLERKLVCRPQIRHTINKLRHKFGKPELVLD